MPTYEYKCGACKRRVSIFFPSFSAAEQRTAAGETRCPRCGSPDLTRLMSRFYSIKSDGDEMGDMGDMGEESDSMFEGLDENDPRSVARWARRMTDTMGSEMDLGPEFDRALDRIESGEDPERVMEDLDPAAMGESGMDEDGDDFGDGGFPEE